MQTITLLVTDSQKKAIAAFAKEFKIPIVKNQVITDAQKNKAIVGTEAIDKKRIERELEKKQIADFLK
jgi:hypothetical protein